MSLNGDNCQPGKEKEFPKTVKELLLFDPQAKMNIVKENSRFAVFVSEHVFEQGV